MQISLNLPDTQIDWLKEQKDNDPLNTSTSLFVSGLIQERIDNEQHSK